MHGSPPIRLSVVIPAYNEELRLPETLRSVTAYLAAREYAAEVIVVDDGSSDGTARLVRDWPAGPVPLRVLAHADGRNHGKGAAVRHGFAAARGEFRLFMDADNSTAIDQVEPFWPHFEAGYDLVIGSRGARGADVVVHQSWLREIGGKLGNRVIRLLAARGIADTQAGFKMFRGSCIEDLLPLLRIDRWGFDVELIVAARQRGYRVAEVPIRWVNSPSSKVPAGAYLQVLAEVWRVRQLRRAGNYDR